METENVQVQEEEVVQEEVTSTEDTNESQDEIVPLKKSDFKKLQRKAIAYDSIKEKAKDVVKENQNINNSLSAEDVEFKILQSQGVDEELLLQMRDLAKLRGKSLLAVKDDPIIVALKEAKEAEMKAKKASLPASRGSAPVKKEKTINTPGLSEEEHKALWREQLNK